MEGHMDASGTWEAHAEKPVTGALEIILEGFELVPHYINSYELFTFAFLQNAHLEIYKFGKECRIGFLLWERLRSNSDKLAAKKAILLYAKGAIAST